MTARSEERGGELLPGLDGLLLEWLPRQRWFAGKGRPLSQVRVVSVQKLSARVHHTVVEVTYRAGESERYQVPVTQLAELDQERGYARIAPPHADDDMGGPPFYYDGLHEPEGTAAVFDLLRESASAGSLRGTAATELEDLTGLPVGAEQSNTSVVFGDAYILKVFRRISPGLNPDLEITRVLAEAESPHVAAPVGWLEGELDGELTTLAVCSRFLKSGTEGWKLALASVRDLFAEGDLHADEVGGDFAGESERLGTATAEVHALLAERLPSRRATTEELSETSSQMLAQLEAAAAEVPELTSFSASLAATFAALPGETGPGVPVQRIHGDYHLGQVMRIDSGWVLLDFEGEPARPLPERVRLASPLRDVAGMLRSFDYASRFLLQDRVEPGHLAYRAEEWAQRNRAAFCDGYATGAGADPREAKQLLRTFELDKAVYEVLYEARHRPSWVNIPLAAIERLVGEAG
ncbi:MAG TPA: phosphotransferase [Frankiaceae bacterium]|jgi:maltokinase|nr:phosphotransferase [Frankiaceae bacterium]